MRVLLDETTAEGLSQLIYAGVHADYVYMYPPRQAYRPFEPDISGSFGELVERSLARFDGLNLYVHVPFCRQICSFCNLYTTNDLRRDLQGYVDTVLMEAAHYATLTDKKQIRTVYLGGGTPSILTPAQIEQLITTLLDLFSSTPNHIPPETALEVDPSTVDAGKLRELRSAGINRINLGYQSMVEREVIHIGRRRGDAAGFQLLEEALTVGFANVCVDLIYGLQHQTDDNWCASVRQVADAGPQTICAYALTLRPYTGYQRRGYGQIDGRVLYRRFDMADQILRDAGYRRETHVRWVKDGGGYLQKVNHWGMQNILGFGAGARSYLWEIDYRNSYSVRERNGVLDQYANAVDAGKWPATDGFFMSDEERMRKAAALNIQSLDRQWFFQLFGVDPLVVFEREIATLTSLGMCHIDDNLVTLTDIGTRYRDLIAQGFFSTEVRRRLRKFDYNE
ncbi:coproporphyrinogen-III oxidase family protein [Microbispora sp. H10949]|uniref:coproporphyrinogen-III oxidase family protein n=1 Tax=Microbispora sp. H10949 TaxID=2729111 RepID=UPI0015FFE1E4|nr:radical SAM protein [Microbispora sp. H10949]